MSKKLILNVSIFSFLFLCYASNTNASIITYSNEQSGLTEFLEPANLQKYDQIGKTLGTLLINVNVLYPVTIVKETDYYDYNKKSLVEYISVTGAIYLDLALDATWRKRYNEFKQKWGSFEFYHDRGITPDDIHKKKKKLPSEIKYGTLFAIILITLVVFFRKKLKIDF